MYKTKVIAVVGTFILVAAMKFFAPAAVLEVKEIVTADTDYRAVFTELGNRVAGSGEEIAVVLGFQRSRAGGYTESDAGTNRESQGKESQCNHDSDTGGAER